MIVCNPEPSHMLLAHPKPRPGPLSNRGSVRRQPEACQPPRPTSLNKQIVLEMTMEPRRSTERDRRSWSWEPMTTAAAGIAVGFISVERDQSSFS
ncbi:hypothetical protein BDV59DRAFT_182126 [Aspergillus ambiguus]|uniref:uncharacterized protein n=1 Tax=Aspergillus ambiguus TaxID=176160 RepID=UPI003CCCCE1E